jgi:hypothetical protein
MRLGRFNKIHQSFPFLNNKHHPHFVRVYEDATMSTAIPYQSIQTQSHEFQLDELNQPFLDNQNNDNDNDSDNDNDNNQDDDSNDNEYRTKQEKVEEGDDSAETVQRVNSSSFAFARAGFYGIVTKELIMTICRLYHVRP